MPARSTGFVVTALTRPSGTPYWLASGTLNSRQLRREFSERHAAFAFAEARNSEMRGVAPNQVPVLTHLSADQVREAETVTANLRRAHPTASLTDILEFYDHTSGSISVTEAGRLANILPRLREKFPDVGPALALEWFLANYRPPKSAITLRIALENYAADVARRRMTGSLSEAQLRSISFAAQQLEKYFGSETTLATLTSSALQQYLRETTRARDGSESFSNKTWVNRRGYVSALMEFCRNENWLDENPAQQIKNYSKKDIPKAPTITLTTVQAAKLMSFLEGFQEGRMVPYFALCLFCGIRPDIEKGEIGRLKPSQIDTSAGLIHLRSTDTKTRKPRIIKIQPNLIAWLRAYPLETHPIKAVNFRKLLLKIRKDWKLAHDVLRHTFCSMLVATHRSVGDAALQAGNSENILWSNYLNLVSKSEADAFWDIRPSKSAGA